MTRPFLFPVNAMKISQRVGRASIAGVAESKALQWNLFPSGNHLCLAVVLSVAKPTETDAKSDVSDRNHLGTRLMIPCRETIWGESAVRGVSLRSTPRLNLDFSLREKSCQFSDFSCRRVAVGGVSLGVGGGCCRTSQFKEPEN